MSLLDFVSLRRHTIERERLLHLTAVRELKLHAARHGARLMITEPELDIEGFDFTISSEFESLYVQSKGTMKRRGARSWSIRAALIKPSFYDRDLVPDLDGWAVGGFAVGATGGVLIHVIDEVAADDGRFEVSYRYLDIFWLIRVASGMSGQPMSSRERALRLLREIRDADDNHRVKLNFRDFVKLNSVSALAALRLHIGGPSNWASGCHVGVDIAQLGEPGVVAALCDGARDNLAM